MLEAPDIRDDRIVACLRAAYDLRIGRVGFLPLGADPNTAVYRAVADDETPYFVKLRRGAFDDKAVALARFLCDQGLAQIIAPLSSRSGELWAGLDGELTLSVFPFVAGRDGFTVPLTDRHWSELGRALKRLHTATLPPALAARIPRESYSERWRESARHFLARIERESFEDPVSAELARFLGDRREAIHALVERAERLGRALRTQTPEQVLCHSDVHAGNILIDAAERLYVVDWDDVIFAPKERDLMFIGGGLGFKGCTPQEEEARFFRGYGPTRVDPNALAYYRCERIVQDIALYCADILTKAEGDDRAQALRYVKASFLPGGAVEGASVFPRPTPSRIG